jgi:invasion protein IalB
VALAQTLQPKAAPSAQQAAPAAPSTAQPAPEQAAQAPRRHSWELSCDPANSGLNCRAKRTLVTKDSRKPVVTVYIAVPAATKQPTMLVRLPLGIYLPSGASVSFGQGEPKPLTLQRCGTSGCYGEYAITEADIAAIMKGADLTFAAENRDRKPLQFVMRADAAGFSEAYAKIK